MERPPKPKTITLTLTPPKADDRDATFRRLRLALKALWRAYGLRCTRVQADGTAATVDSIEREQDQ